MILLGRKKKKYRKVTIALSTQKAELFEIYCRNKRMTPNKFIRKVIAKNLEGFDGEFNPKPLPPKQLDMFD